MATELMQPQSVGKVSGNVMPPVMVVDKALQAGEFSPDSEVENKGFIEI